MTRYLLALDQGTTGSTALIIDSNLTVLGKANVEFKQHYPKPGWVEHDLDEIWESMKKAIQAAIKTAGIDGKDIAGIGITNQRETIGAWNKDSRNPLGRAIVWQCRRSSEICQGLKDNGSENEISQTTGLLLDPYFSGSKIKWWVENDPRIGAAIKDGSARLGTIDTYLISKLTAGKSHVTEPSNACRTLLMNLETLEWDPKLLELFGANRKCLPEILPSDGEFGLTQGLDILPDGIPIRGVLGDQQAALFGQACFEPKQAKLTYGTGCFLLVNTGSEILRSKSKLLSSVAWNRSGQTVYCLEGSAFIAGAAVQWLRDELQLIKKAPEIEGLAKEAKDEDMGDLLFVPSFTGLGAPHWKADARASLTGITRGTNRAHLARAVLEGIALQNSDLMDAMANDGSPIEDLRVDGGACENDFLMQIQSDITQIPITRPTNIETTALGAAMVCGLGMGIWKDEAEVQQAWKKDRSFTPNSKRVSYYQGVRKNWKQTIERF